MLKSLKAILIPISFVFFLLIGGVKAKDSVTFNAQIDNWDRVVEEIFVRLESNLIGPKDEDALRARLNSIIDAAKQARFKALRESKEVENLLATLGSKLDSIPESDSVAARRISMEETLAKFQGLAKQTKLIIVKGNQALGEIGARSRERLKAQLFDQTTTPINAAAWFIAVPEALDLATQTFIVAPFEWWQELAKQAEIKSTFIRNLLTAIFIALAGWFVGKRLRKNYGRVHELQNPTYARRVFAGAIEGTGRTLAPILFVIILSSTTLQTELVGDTLASVLQGGAQALVLFLFGYALINAAFTPRRPEWRLLNFQSEGARLLVHRLKLNLGVYLFFEGINVAFAWAAPSVELRSISSLIYTLVMAPLLLLLLSGRIWVQKGDLSIAIFPRIRSVTRIILLALPLFAALGYSGLANYLLSSLVLTALTMAGLGMLRVVGRETLAVAFSEDYRLGRILRDHLALNDGGVDQVSFWLRTLFDGGLFILAGLALLPVWGFSASETTKSASNLLNGIQIGSYTFSLIDIIFGLLLFSLIISGTRIIQRALERHFLPNLSSDKGVRDALKTGVGYVGFIIAGLVAISALGLDLTNLALIAGALSVGLGFGLQNVVSNFVSGLILLVERPIKPGDWVIIGGHEGTVKKVNVRSTEVETFQRASVIIPNADLIASPVINWTHKNILGRVEVSIGVAYGSNPKEVEKILLDCARAHTNILENPEPLVLFQDFGDSALVFEVRGFLSNVLQRMRTASDLRHSINEALTEKGIEIPFPQRVVQINPSS